MIMDNRIKTSRLFSEGIRVMRCLGHVNLGLYIQVKKLSFLDWTGRICVLNHGLYGKGADSNKNAEVFQSQTQTVEPLEIFIQPFHYLFLLRGTRYHLII